MGTSDCGQSVRRASDNPTCSWHLECVCVCVCERERDWAFTCGIWCYLQVDGVRIELSCRTPSWCWGITRCGGKNSHTGIVVCRIRLRLWNLKYPTSLREYFIWQCFWSGCKMCWGLKMQQWARRSSWACDAQRRGSRLLRWIQHYKVIISTGLQGSSQEDDLIS